MLTPDEQTAPSPPDLEAWLSGEVQCIATVKKTGLRCAYDGEYDCNGFPVCGKHRQRRREELQASALRWRTEETQFTAKL